MKKGFMLIGFVLITVISGAQKNIFAEDFKTNKAKWKLYGKINKDSATATVTNGKLLLDNKQQGFALSLNEITNKKININTDEEVTLSASFTHLTGQNLAGYGLLLGQKLSDDKYNGYVFTIVDTGYYRMYIAKDGKQIKYLDWTPSEAIKTGNGTNLLTIIKKRNQFHFLINGQWLFNIDNANILVNSVGIVATDKQKIALDNIKVESFTKEKDKKEADRINELTVLLELSNTFFTKAFSKKNTLNFPVTWLPYLQEENKNVNLLIGSYHPSYHDNWDYEKNVFELKVKQYKSYIEKAMVNFEKIERTTVLGKETYWLSKNEKYVSGVYIMLKDYKIDNNYFIQIHIENDKDLTRERIEKMK